METTGKTPAAETTVDETGASETAADEKQANPVDVRKLFVDLVNGP